MKKSTLIRNPQDQSRRYDTQITGLLERETEKLIRELTTQEHVSELNPPKCLIQWVTHIRAHLCDIQAIGGGEENSFHVHEVRNRMARYFKSNSGC